MVAAIGGRKAIAVSVILCVNFNFTFAEQKHSQLDANNSVCRSLDEAQMPSQTDIQLSMNSDSWKYNSRLSWM